MSGRRRAGPDTRRKFAWRKRAPLAHWMKGGTPMPKHRLVHPFEHHPSLRAVIAAAPSVADLARETRDDALLGRLTIACGDLVHGFASPPESHSRLTAHRRAWTTVREIDRSVTAARINRLASARVIAKAQRAIDRADVLIGALLPD